MVESDGRGLSSTFARTFPPLMTRVRMGHAANRVAQMNLDFDVSVILADIEAGVNLDALWRPDELEALVAGGGRT